MKNRLFTALCIGLALTACNKENSGVAPSPRKSHVASGAAYRLPTSLADTANSKFIPVDSANEMISSFLYSIGSSGNDSDVRSFTVNADSLRNYLNNNDIKNVKLIFAHTLNYMHAGYYGQYAGYQAGAITIVIAGYDNAGNYIYHGGNVLDHVAPCPYSCPSGSAGNDLLQ